MTSPEQGLSWEGVSSGPDLVSHLEVEVLLGQGSPPLPVLGHEHGVGGRVQLPGAPHLHGNSLTRLMYAN